MENEIIKQKENKMNEAEKADEKELGISKLKCEIFDIAEKMAILSNQWNALNKVKNEKHQTLADLKK